MLLLYIIEMNRRGLMKRPLFVIIACVLAAALVVGVAYFVWWNRPSPAFTKEIGSNIESISLRDERLNVYGSVTITDKADIDNIYGYLQNVRLKEVPLTTATMRMGSLNAITITTKDGKEYYGSFLSGSLEFNSKMYLTKSDYFDGLKDRYDEYFKKYPVTPLVSDKP